MIEISETEVVGWEHATRGMRNPMNSWDKSDSVFKDGVEYIGSNDLDLMKRLSNAGSDHAKFLRMIVIYTDITAPLYWWKEFDTYKVGTVRNSCSTMHKIHSREFTLDDFSCEYIDKDVAWSTVAEINFYRNAYNNYEQYVKELKDDGFRDDDIPPRKSLWYSMIKLLPSSYNQKSTVMLNYQVLKNMYHSRKNHKLDEWREFCKWIESLPYSELITGGKGDVYEI